MTTNADLLCCPFCGGKGQFNSDDDGWNWIECEGCGVATNRRASLMDDCKPILAETWNRRHINKLTEKWIPIERAPKDGTQILVTNGITVAQGWWEHQEPYIREQRDLAGVYIDQQENDGFDGWLDCEGGMLPEPTHWMPLPSPPSLKEKP